MKIEAMKKIAEARTPGNWEHRYSDHHHGVYFGKFESLNIALNIGGRGNYGEIEEKANARFIAMAANTYDKLLAVAEAAKNSPCRHITDIISNNCETCKALEELERE